MLVKFDYETVFDPSDQNKLIGYSIAWHSYEF